MTGQSLLLDVLQQSMAKRTREGMTILSLDKPLPSHAPDFFSNDYLSLSKDHSVRENFLRRVQEAAPTRLLGSTGSRLTTGNSAEINALETMFGQFFGAPSALLFNSGFNANLAFISSVPQKNDVIIYDELIHSSSREGIRLSLGTSYRFVHNSIASFKECLLSVLEKHPHISQGTSTVFVLVESIYSMDGDFCPLTEIVGLVETLVPSGHAHLVVDEAHTSGTCGPNGTGYVSHLGLNDRVHTKVHTFGKAWGFHGAVVLTSPIIRDYLINSAKHVIFSTSMPYTDIYALEACLSVLSSPGGQKLRQSLNCLSGYARQKFSTTFQNIPETVLALDKSDATLAISDCDLCSPIISVFTPLVAKLADYLLRKGYAVTPLTYPAVRRPRIRIIIHAGNTEKEIDSLTDELLAWAELQESVFSNNKSAGGSLGVRESFTEARARL